MDRAGLWRTKLSTLLPPGLTPMSNSRGAAMLLVLLLALALIPAAGTLASMAQQDLAASLDDFHRAKAQAAACAGLALVEVDLLQGVKGKLAGIGMGN